MYFKSQFELSQETQFFSHRPVLRLFIIGFLFISAFGIRLHHITKPPLDFAPIRQYQSAHIARGYYVKTLESISEWKKEIADLNMERMGFSMEPRIMERTAVFGYRIAGREHLWIPRLLSSIFWLVGGAFLYLIARKIASPGAALFSAAFYLFLPYSISASRSFQPDPLMIMMLLAGLFTILRYNEQPSILRLLIAGTISALAMLIKPYCLFLIFGVFISLAIYRHGMNRTGSYHGILKALISLNVLIFAVVSLLPTIVYYGYGVLIAGDLREHAQGSFLPHLLLNPYFWKGWLTMIGHVVGYIPFIGAILGFLIFQRGVSRALLIGLWLGYLLYGLFATYHIHTHDYYHLQLIPVVALSLGPIGASIMNRMTNLLVLTRWRVAILSILLLTVVLGAGLNIRHIQLRNLYTDYKSQLKFIGAIFGVNPQFNEFIAHDYAKEVRMAKEIGEVVNHSSNTVFLSSDYGRSLTYHGELSGLPWYTSSSLRELREIGIQQPDKEELFNARYFMMFTHGKYIKYIPEFFIVTDFEELEKQTDLKEFLTKSFPLIAKNDEYLIFDLGNMSD